MFTGVAIVTCSGDCCRGPWGVGDRKQSRSCNVKYNMTSEVRGQRSCELRGSGDMTGLGQSLMMSQFSTWCSRPPPPHMPNPSGSNRKPEVQGFHEETRVTFSPLSEELIWEYIDSGEPM